MGLVISSYRSLPQSVQYSVNPWAGLFHCTCAGRAQPRTAEALSNAHLKHSTWAPPRTTPVPGCGGTRKPYLKGQETQFSFTGKSELMPQSIFLVCQSGSIKSTKSPCCSWTLSDVFGSEFSHMGCSFPLSFVNVEGKHHPGVQRA